MIKRPALIFLLFCAGLLYPSAEDGYRFVRTTGVPGPGWYSLDLDRHMWIYAGGRLESIDARGEITRLPIRSLPGPRPLPSESRPDVEDIKMEGDHCIMTLRVKPGLSPHRAVTIVFSDRHHDPHVRLEGSRHGDTWDLLAEGTLYHLSNDPTLQKAELSYPPDRSSLLRISLTRSGLQPLPPVKTILLAHVTTGAPFPWIEEEVSLLPVDSDLAPALGMPRHDARLLDLPPGTRDALSLSLPLPDEHPPITVTLWSLSGGKLVKHYSCILQPGTLNFPLPRKRLESPAILQWRHIPVTDERVTVRRPLQKADLYVSDPRTVRIGYGGVEKHPSDAPPTVPRQQDEVPGEWKLNEYPLRLSREMIALVQPADDSDIQIDREWGLVEEEPCDPWQWVECVIGPELYDPVDGRPDRLVILGPDGIVPSFLLTDARPLRVMSRTLHFTVDDTDPDTHVTEFNWEQIHLPLSFLILSAPKGPMEHGLSLRIPRETEKRYVPGDKPEDPWKTVLTRTVRRDPWSDSFILNLDLEGIHSDRFQLSLHGKDVPPPPSIDSVLWRKQHRLVFPMPPGPARLCLVADSSRIPRGKTFEQYIDLSSFPETLPRLTPGDVTLRVPDRTKLKNILFLVSLILAAAALLFLIVRLLPAKTRNP